LKLSASNTFIASFIEKKIIGVVSYRLSENFLIVDNVEVDSDYFGFGVGSNLLANISKIALDTEGIDGVLLLTSKTLTVDFYNKLFNMNNDKNERRFIVFPQNSLFAVKNYLTTEVLDDGFE
jgi:N-acetylglutamate synthase-like GNAT family acetyltransferase